MYKVITLETGFFLADGGAMFGAIPKRAWSKKYSSDENNLCRLAMRSVLAISENRKIIVDTGIRHESIQKFSYYGFTDVKQVDECIAEQGLLPEDVTDVVLTHLHFDHCGASTKKNEKGEWNPMFPNARYWISEKQWNTAAHPDVLEEDAFQKADFEPLLAANKVNLIVENTKIDDAFMLKLFDGHTAGQIACYIDGEDEKFLIPGDVVPTSVHISLAWISAYDVNAQVAVHSKIDLLDDAVAENRELIFYHDAYKKMAKVVKNGDMFMVKR